VSGGGEEDWPERPSRRRSGRHGRAEDEYRDRRPYAQPDRYPADQYPADQYPADRYPPDQYPAERYPADQYRADQYPAGRHPADRPPADRYPADRYPVDRYGRPDPLTAPGRYAAPDPLAPSGRGLPPDPYPARGRGRPDPLSDPRPPSSYAPQRPAGPDPFATQPPPGRPAPRRPDALSGPHARADRGAGPDALTDPSARRAESSGPQGGYPPSRPGRGRQDSYDPLAMPPSQNGYGTPGAGDAPGASRYQNGYRPAAQPVDPRRASGDQGRYVAPPGRGDGDAGPYRWRPPQAPEPEELAPLPDYRGGAAPGPGLADDRWNGGQERRWDGSQEHDWDLRDDTGAPGLAEPVRDVPTRRPWQPDPAGPDDWAEPSPIELIPGLDDAGSRRGGRGRRRRISRFLAPALALVLLAVLGAGAYKVYRHFQSPDYSGPGFGEVTVQVLPNASAFSIAPELVQLGVVASTSSLISAAKNSTNPEGLEPGFFRLRHHMNSALAWAMLLNPAARIQSVVTIPEGLRETQILQTLEAKTNTPASKFAAALKDTAALGLPSYANGNPEGFLFPATYDFNPGTSALSMLQTMVARYNQEAASINLPAAARTAQLTENQVITVASILEAEAGSPKYYAEVAEVIYNRLNQNMFLGLDSTVNYALHRFGVSLTNAQMQVNSPYNTFIHKGLPPGPIDSPGAAAIEAALHPAQGTMLYFVTVNLKTGLTLFTNSPAQFQQFVNECDQNHAC
jgi:UPF0755 protein